MRSVIFILILLTICTFGQAQNGQGNKPVRLVFTSNFQQYPFGQDPVWQNWPAGSFSRALTYINAHRKNMREERFAWINCGENISDVFRLFPEKQITERIYGYMEAPFQGKEPGFELQGIYFQEVYIDRDNVYFGYYRMDIGVKVALFTNRGASREQVAAVPDIDIAVMASGLEPEVFRVINIDGDTVTVINTGTTGKYIGVADFMSETDFSVKTVDISGFPVDAEYEEHFRPLCDSIRDYFNTPIAALTHTIRQSDALFGSSAYTGLFHRFQLEAGEADVSFFASPVWGDSIPAGPVTPKDIVRRFRYDNRLCAVELTGAEIRNYLEYTYGLRYHTMRRSTDDLLRMTRDRDGILRMRTALYNLDDAGGICYEVNVSKPQGHRVRIISMADGKPFEPARRYRVTMNSHRALSGGYLSRGTGLSEAELEARVIWTSDADYRILLQSWLAAQGVVLPGNPSNWQIVPESFVAAAKQRWAE